MKLKQLFLLMIAFATSGWQEVFASESTNSFDALVWHELSDLPMTLSGDGWSVDGTNVCHPLDMDESTSLYADFTLNNDAVFTFQYDFVCCDTELIIDGELILSFSHDEIDSNSIANYHHPYYFSLSAGEHHIEWSFVKRNEYCYAIIKKLGLISTPLTSVSLLEPGSLGTEVLYYHNNIKDVQNLKITGKMNDEDWETIKLMENLFKLDLSDAVITEIPDQQFATGFKTSTGVYQTTRKHQYLSKVLLPQKLKTIGQMAFAECLAFIEIPKGITNIKEAAFQNSRIVKADLSCVSVISACAFQGCFFLNSVVLSDSLKIIDCNAFYNDTKLECLFKLPESLTHIYESAFRYCIGVNIRFPHHTFDIGSEALYGSGIDSLVIYEPINFVGYLGKRNFSNLPKLRYIEWPQEMTQLSEYFGYDCPNLNTIKLKSPTVVGATTGFGENSLPHTTLIVPDYLVNSYKVNSYWYNAKEIVGFNPEELDELYIQDNLTLNHERISGTPNVKLKEGIVFKVNGDDPQVFGDFTICWSFANNNPLYTQIAGSCENVNIEGTSSIQYNIRPFQWYFLTLPFDAKVSDISVDNGASFAIRYYDGVSRAQSGTGGNWKNYTKEDTIPTGTSFIFQTSKECWASFKSLDNENKSRLFINKEFVKPLIVYASEEKANRSWNMVGNPWLTYYNIHKLNFVAPITTWNGRSYTAYSIIDDDYAIKPLEAFFVQCPDELSTISFPIDGRQLTAEITDQNGARAQDNSRKLVDVELTDGELTDKTRFVLNPQASLDYETTCDASKFFSMDASVPQLYTLELGQAMAINERPLADGTVQLGIRVAQDGAYTISAPRCQFDHITLVDLLTGTETNLASESYHFTANSGTDNARFVLHVDGSSLNGVECVAMPSQQATPVFNLNGQRIQQPRKGLFIQEHKKIIR